MATNIPMLAALNQYAKGLSKLFSKLRKGVIPPASQIDEAEAWTRLLRQHIRAQKQQGGQFPNDTYQYNPLSKEIERCLDGEVVSTT